MIPVGVIAQGGATVPNAPTSFTATAVAGGVSVNLSWVAPSFNGGLPVTSYTISRGGTAIHTTADGSTTSYTNTGLSPMTAYSYTVVANNLVGSSATASTSVTTSAGAPSAPTIVIQSYVTGGFRDNDDNPYDGTEYSCYMYLPNNNGSPIVDTFAPPYYNPVYVDYSFDNVNWTPLIRDNLANTGNNPARFYPFVGGSSFYIRAAFRNAVGVGDFSSSVYLLQRY
jgi:hypothetical protein